MARTKDPELENARRQMVADAAIELLASESWRGVTLSAVARRAGVSKGVVTYWFESKDTLFLEAIRRFHALYAERLVELASQPLPVADRLDAILAAAFPDHETVAREVAFQAEVWSFAKSRPEVLDEIRLSYGHFRLACEALVTIGRAEGFVTAEGAEELSLYIHALVDGMSLHVAFDPTIDVAAARKKMAGLISAWLDPTA